jgi:hypothetical protein
VAELAALVAAAALAAMLFASRLPPGPEFLLPRRGGFALYRAAWALFGVPGGRTVFSAAVALLLLACLAVFVAVLRRSVRKWPATWSARAALALGPLAAVFLAARACTRSLDLIQLVWFPYGAMDAREPFAAFALFALAFVPAAAAARAWTAGRRRRGAALCAALAVLDVGGLALGAAKGVSLSAALPTALGKTLFVVLTEGPKGPDREAYALSPDVFSGGDPRAFSRAFAAPGRRDARALPALRALYEEDVKRWDLVGLRDDLLLGASRGDPLAPSLLLAHLAAVAPTPEATAALGALADESSWRVGPLGAAAISRAYAHLGDREAAVRWAAKAGGPQGIAPGLLAPSGGGTLKPGRVAGILRAPGRSRVALYLKTDPAAPYLLDAAGLVAAAEPDARGRFVFTGLSAGRYYLALAIPEEDGRRGEVSVSGSRGDLILDARRPTLDLPPLTIKFTPR